MKEFFTMGEVSAIAQVPAYTLRYWESQIASFKPSRLTSGHRRYTKKDLETILRIKDLIAGKGMTSMGARQALRKRRVPEALISARDASEATTGGPDDATAQILRELKKEIRGLLEEFGS